MWPTLSAEEASDSFQAFSNSFSFTFQRPLQYLAYAIGIFVIALATASGVLEKPIPTHTAAKSATVPMVASAANYFPATKLASVAKP